MVVNLCEISGCRASCCHDMELPWRDNDPPIADFFPTAQVIDKLSSDTPDGVYIQEESTRINVIIYGNCPNLINNNCENYLNRPPVCKKLRIFGPECVEARRRDGTEKINKEVYRYSPD